MALSDARRLSFPQEAPVRHSIIGRVSREAGHRDPTLGRGRQDHVPQQVPLVGKRRVPPARLASIPAAPLLGERARQDLPEHLDAAQDPFLVDVPETENQGRRHVRLACPRGIDPVARQAVYADGAAQC